MFYWQQFRFAMNFGRWVVSILLVQDSWEDAAEEENEKKDQPGMVSLLLHSQLQGVSTVSVTEVVNCY